ncbi:MAG TPA: Hpt domain-containing protein [Polyangia bacterium]|nr:Hpt domain-containing protein [Polyangia bacterium]
MTDFDDEMMEQLASCGLLEEVASLYVAEAAMLLARIHAACVARDAAALGRAAHALKGASGSVGARRVMLLSAEVERAVKTGREDEAFDGTEGLEAALGVAMRSLARHA